MSARYLWLTASLPGVFCLMACRARWNQLQALNNKPAESSWEEEGQIQERFRKTCKNRQIREKHHCQNLPCHNSLELAKEFQLVMTVSDVAASPVE